MKESSISIEISGKDALDFECDALILKYAQHLYGADAAVHARLSDIGKEPSLPDIGEAVITSSSGAVGARYVAFPAGR